MSAPSPAPAPTPSSTPTRAESEVLDEIRDMYDAFLARDRQRFDSHLASDVTTWETPFPRLISRGELDAFRDERPPSVVAQVQSLRVEAERVDVWGDHALARYLLIASKAGAEGEEISRVTDVLLRDPRDGWRIVHHHSELWARGASAPASLSGSASSSGSAPAETGSGPEAGARG
ncbi:YybH family protein [Herbiconiux sp. YIM B11900]|uniref:YybH family protein n=1 Tax=Herbiconiux sp. YIM B11900 TaxID=3404131 RepID=UPI003F87A8F1